MRVSEQAGSNKRRGHRWVLASTTGGRSEEVEKDPRRRGSAPVKRCRALAFHATKARRTRVLALAGRAKRERRGTRLRPLVVIRNSSAGWPWAGRVTPHSDENLR